MFSPQLSSSAISGFFEITLNLARKVKFLFGKIIMKDQKSMQTFTGILSIFENYAKKKSTRQNKQENFR